jgi:hypothetical protein
MKSVERLFNKLQKDNPRLASFPCLALSIRGKKYPKRTITKWFDILVEKKDYLRSEKEQLINYLFKLTGS